MICTELQSRERERERDVPWSCHGDLVNKQLSVKATH